MKKIMQFVAFLRGINVGGNKKVPMVDLKKVFEDLGFTDVRTILNSGNVIFTSQSSSISGSAIESALEKKFGFPISTVILPLFIIEEIVNSDPFKKIALKPNLQLYVTFLRERLQKKYKLPYTTPDGSFQIIGMTDYAFFSVVDISKIGTTDSMKSWEKEFGPKITTRNWNTVKKMIV